MNRRKVFLYLAILNHIAILAYFILCRGDMPDYQFPEIPESFSGWVVKEPVKIYKENEIFNFVNGEGVIYLEYDFISAAVRQYFNENKNIELAVYNMGNPEDAFGIFSLYRPEDGEITGIGNDDITTDFSVNFWKDRYYVTIVTFNMMTREEIISLAKIIEKNIPDISSKPEIIKHFAEFNQKNIVYFHGKSSLNSIYHIADENILQLNRNTNGIICSLSDD